MLFQRVGHLGEIPKVKDRPGRSGLSRRLRKSARLKKVNTKRPYSAAVYLKMQKFSTTSENKVK